MPSGEYNSVELSESFQPTPVNPKNKNLNGRKPIGAVAKITRDLKHCIIDAAIAYGSDGNGEGALTGYLFFSPVSIPARLPAC
jgi:hypothetical protein